MPSSSFSCVIPSRRFCAASLRTGVQASGNRSRAWIHAVPSLAAASTPPRVIPSLGNGLSPTDNKWVLRTSEISPARNSLPPVSSLHSSMSLRPVKLSNDSFEEVQGSVSDNGIGFIVLNRPKALNAMNLEMDVAFAEILESHKNDPSVKIVVVHSTSPRAFCSGGDVKDMTTNKFLKLGPKPTAEKVFSVEYKLVCDIRNFPKPYLSILDGIVMGFGMGLSLHGKYKIITEKTVMAMPENAIGLFPDVGFSYLVSNNSSLGMYLGLTGERISNSADIFFSDLANVFIHSEKIPDLKKALLETDFSTDSHSALEKVLEKFSQVPEPNGKLTTLLPHIEKSFGSKDSLFEILESLKEETSNKENSEWAQDTLATLEKKCPFSLFVTERLIREVSRNANSEYSTIESVMKLEYRIALGVSTRGDFTEGVRAVLVDKDQNAKWNPPRIQDVNGDEVDSVFLPFDNETDELQVN